MAVTTTLIRRAWGSPVIASFAGNTPQEANHRAWRYVRNTGLYGFRMEQIEGPHYASDPSPPAIFNG